MLIDGTSLNSTISMLNKALDAESLRWKVVANNVANVNTPNFKKSEVLFESELKKAMRSEAEIAKENFPLNKIKNPPIPFYDKKDISEVQPRVKVDYMSAYNNNRNNVNIEEEMVTASQTKMRYDAFTSFLSRMYRKIGFLAR